MPTEANKSTVTLIPRREALKILTWVNGSSLYAGAYGTDKLTRYPAGKVCVYSREECEALRDEVMANGIPPKRVAQPRSKPKPQITELT